MTVPSPAERRPRLAAAAAEVAAENRTAARAGRDTLDRALADLVADHAGGRIDTTTLARHAARTTRARQGLPPTVDDPAVLARAATLIRRPVRRAS